MSVAKQYPYQQLQLSNLKGEYWKDIPGLEGIFQVSNVGRVRSLDRVVPHSRCGTQFVKGRIIRQRRKQFYNRFAKDYKFNLQVALMQETVRYEYPVRRLVYAAFADPTVLTTEQRMVISADGDGLNCRIENLRLTTNGERHKMIYQQGRLKSYLSYADRSRFKPNVSLWKPVHQCNLHGKILATFPSIVEAARQLKFHQKCIGDAARGIKKYYRGYKWRFVSKHTAKSIIQTYLK